MRASRLLLLLTILAFSLAPADTQAPEARAAARRALERLFPAPQPAALVAERALAPALSSALGCELVAGLPLSTAIDVYRLDFALDGAPFAMHVSADGSLTQPCDERVANLGAGVIPLLREGVDGDGDGWRDRDDACPQIAGSDADARPGCPRPAPDDGDGDGVLNAADRCPEQAGSPFAEGCALLRDRDGDGAPDDSDICPDQRGIIRGGFALGCPADGSGASSQGRAPDATCHVNGDSLPIFSEPGDEGSITDWIIPALALPRHSAVLARTADGAWLQLASGWVRATQLRGACYNIPLINAAAGDASGCFMRPSGARVTVREGPNGRIVSRLESHETQAVLGRNHAGDWLFFRGGWASLDQLELSGVCDSLPALNPAQVGSGVIDLCPPGFVGYLTPRISIGTATARVASTTLANRLRAAPALDAELIGEIPPRTIIDAVLDGPACNLAFVWWQVQVDGVVGWTVESDLNAYHYYLEPMPNSGSGLASADKDSPRAPTTVALPASGRMIHSGNIQRLDTVHLLQVNSPQAVAWSPSGQLAIVQGNGQIALYASPTFARVNDVSLAPPIAGATAVAFTPTGWQLIIGGADGSISLASLASDVSPRALPSFGALPSPVRALTSSHVGDRLAAISGDESLSISRRAGALQLWSASGVAPAGSQLSLPLAFPYPLTAVAFSRDDRWLAVSGETERGNRAALWVYDVATGALEFSKPLVPTLGHALLRAAPTADLGDFVYSSGDSLYQLALESGADLRFYHQGGGVLQQLAFRPHVIAGAEALMALLLRDRLGRAELHISNALSAKSPTTRLPIEASALAFSEDGAMLALAQADQNRVLILGVPAG